MPTPRPLALALPFAAVLVMAAAALAASSAPAAGTPPAAAPAAGRGDELEAEVARMSRVAGCSTPTFSPDGERIAFITTLTGNLQVWIVPVTGGFPLQVTAFDDQVSGVSWSPREDLLAVSIAPGGGMNQQIYLLRPDGTGVRRLTDGGKENNWFDGWSDDGRSIAYTSNRAGESMDGWILDLAAGTPRRVVENPGMGSFDDRSRDGHLTLVSRVASRGDSNLFLVDLGDAAGKRSGQDAAKEWLLTPHEPPGNFGNGRFSPDARTVYLLSDKGRDRIAFARVRLGLGLGLGSDAGGSAPGEIEVLAGRDDADLDGFDITEDGTTAALQWNVDGKSELTFYDLATGRSTPGPELPSEVLAGITFSPDGKRLAFTASGAAMPADVWVLDRPSGRLTQLTRSPHPGVDLSTLARPELVHFKAADGLDLSGWLYRPLGTNGPAPFVLSFHGGPEGQERPFFRSDYQALVARGIGVLAPNVRGSSGFGKRFVNLDNGPLRVGSVADIKAAADWLVAQKLATPGHLGIMGGSYGGYMTMAGLAEYPDLFAAGADLFGVVNFATFFAHTEPWMAAISKIEYGDPATQADMLRDLSPLNKIDRVKAATIVLHGANDTNVPVVEAEQVVDNLKRRGVPVEYVLFPDEGHGFRKTANRIRSNVAVVRWFEEYLK